MKKMLILAVVAALATGSLFANEEVLIDFGLLTADIEITDEDGNVSSVQNRQTLMDFANVRFAGSFTDAQRDLMRTSLAIGNWEVELAPSARTTFNMARSMTLPTNSNRFGEVMGVRVHFPLGNIHSWALVRPPFDIPGFERTEVGDDGAITPAESGSPNRFEGGFGLVNNVATVRALAVNVFGLNFPHSLNVILYDHQGNRRSVPMGPLNFDGWTELVWNNPNYIQEVRNRDLRIVPIYPESTPFVRFGGFEIRRDASHTGGDFIAYFRDVKIIFDRAFDPTGRDIDDESVWNIIQEREEARRLLEMERFGQNQILRMIEEQRQAPRDVRFTPTQEAGSDE